MNKFNSNETKDRKIRRSINIIKRNLGIDSEIESNFEFLNNTELKWLKGTKVDYRNCNEIISILCSKFKDKELEEIYPRVQKIENEIGEGVYIERQCKFKLRRLDFNKVKDYFKRDLKLVRYIGESTEDYLRRLGINSIDDLIEHNYFKEDAAEVIQYIENRDYCNLEKILRIRWKKSDFRNILLSNWVEQEDLIFMDVETLGIGESPIILIGIGNYINDNLNVKQYLIRNPSEEYIILDDFIKKMNPKKAIVTFNGRSFDVPVLNRRIAYYGFENRIENVHFDLFHYSRNAFSSLESYSLDKIECEILKIKRHIDIDSGLIPVFYDYYGEKNNIGPLIPIIEHNYVDILSLAELYSLLNSEAEKKLD
ncbi:MAG: ribonuclease H-like domain-containing protein [Candidatus Helarchaeota archaeon]